MRYRGNASEARAVAVTVRTNRVRDHFKNIVGANSRCSNVAVRRQLCCTLSSLEGRYYYRPRRVKHDRSFRSLLFSRVDSMIKVILKLELMQRELIGHKGKRLRRMTVYVVYIYVLFIRAAETRVSISMYQ